MDGEDKCWSIFWLVIGCVAIIGLLFGTKSCVENNRITAEHGYKTTTTTIIEYTKP